MKDIAAVIERGGIERIGIDQLQANVPIYPLLALLADREWRYVEHIEFAPSGAVAFSPDAVLEIEPVEERSGDSGGANSRGELLFGPQRVMFWTFTLYDTR